MNTCTPPAIRPWRTHARGRGAGKPAYRHRQVIERHHGTAERAASGLSGADRIDSIRFPNISLVFGISCFPLSVTGRCRCALQHQTEFQKLPPDLEALQPAASASRGRAAKRTDGARLQSLVFHPPPNIGPARPRKRQPLTNAQISRTDRRATSRGQQHPHSRRSRAMPYRVPRQKPKPMRRPRYLPSHYQCPVVAKLGYLSTAYRPRTFFFKCRPRIGES